MALARVPADELTDVMDTFTTDGGVVVERMIPADVIGAMRDAIETFARDVEPGAASQGLGEGGKVFAGSRTIRFSSLGALSPAFFELLENPTFTAVADRFLLPQCGSYWVNTGQAMLIGPGETAQMLHRDCLNWVPYCAPLWPHCPEITVSAMIALEPVTEAMGATRVIPGSHLWPELHRADHWAGEETVAAELAPGDALVYSGKVIHGGGANVTEDRWRLAMHLSFVVGWLTPEEATSTELTAEQVADLSPRVQRLLGWRSYDPRPHDGGGLWLRHANKLEDELGWTSQDAASAG